MIDLITLFIILAIHAFWIYKLVTYDWSKFDEDSKDDDFLKPYQENDL